MAFTYSDITPTGDGYKLLGYDLEYDEEAIRNSLLNLFIINKGTVPGKPAFGNPINIQVFDLFTFFSQEDLKTAVTTMIERYEPRIKIESIEINLLPEYNRIIIQLFYSYVTDDRINYNSLEIPYTHNSLSYLGGRRRDPIPKEASTTCNSQL